MEKSRSDAAAPTWTVRRDESRRRGNSVETGARLRYRVPLDLTSVDGSYALFPGQVVGVKGCAPSEDGTVVARSVVGGAPAPGATTTRGELRTFASQQGGAPLSVWVAAGPYTTADDLDYAPLHDLLAAAKAAKPDCVVLLGPFVDADHPAAKRNEFSEGEEAVDAATLFARPPGDTQTVKMPSRCIVCVRRGADVFLNIQGRPETERSVPAQVLKVAWALERALDADPDGATQFVLAPSTRDVVGAPVFPQPPLGTTARAEIAGFRSRGL